MAEPTMIAPISALDGKRVPGRSGNGSGAAGVHLRERRGLAIATVAARRGERAAFARALNAAYGIVLSAGPMATIAGAITLVGVGPDRYLWIDGAPMAGTVATLAAALHGLASISDQSGGTTLLRLDGARVRDLLAKGVDVDLDPKRFGIGAAAAIPVAQIPVTLWQAAPATDGQPAYELALPRSYAQSFLHWLEEGAAEFGLETLPAEP